MYEDMILQADDFSIVLNPVEKDWGFKIDTLVNSVKHINYDADNYERDIIYPLIITPIQKGKAINVSTAGGSKEGIIIKVDGRYFSITSNYKDIVEQEDTNNISAGFCSIRSITEQPVLSAYSKRPDRIFRCVV